VKWGSLNLSANTSLLAFIYSDWLKTQGEMEKSQRYFDFAVSQINYILGGNPDRRSYVIGYGNKSPRNPHHRTAHGSWANDSKNPPQSRNLLIGALVGGPDENEQWHDDRNDWVTNEVAIGYNAGFTGAVAKMYSEFGGQPLAKISFPKNDEREIYVQSKVTKQNQGLKINAAIVNKSATPARGLENARLRIMYTIEPEKADLVSVSSPVNDCSNDPSKPVKVKENLYYVEIDCQGTVIYPGGQSEYQKQVELQLNFGTQQSSIFTNLTGIFSQPIQVNSISLYNEKELIWEKTMN
jgi:hypothetical protein